MHRLLSFLAGAALMACGGGPTHPDGPPGGGVGTQQLTSTHFRFTYASAEVAWINAVAAQADADVPRILTELGATGMPQVEVTYYMSHAAMADAVRPIVGQIPSFASGLVTSSRQIHLVSSAGTTPDAIIRKKTTLLHEFAHCVSLHRNPGIANNPRWLWETVAIYAAGDRGDPGRLATVLAGPQPTFAQLNSFDQTTIYDVGFGLGEFIVDRGGFDALRSLLMTNGDTASALGLGPEPFLAAWFAWVRAR